MLRISRNEIVERWTMTYSEDGYYVRADQVEGFSCPMPVNQVVPAIEATKEDCRVLVWVIESQQTLDDPHISTRLASLECGPQQRNRAARGRGGGMRHRPKGKNG